MRARVALLSVASPWSPRVVYAVKICRRSSRFSAPWRKGHRLGAWSVNSHFPSRPAFFAASAPPATTRSERPARSSFFSITSRYAFVSLSRLSPNFTDKVASSPLIARSRSWPSFGRSAPPRTKSFQVSSRSLLLVGVEGERGPRVPHRLDPREESRIEPDVVAVCRHHRRHLLLDRLQRVARLGRGEVREDARHLLEQPARGVERLDRVREGGRGRALRDRLHLAAVLRDPLLDRGQEVLGPDLVEGRDAEGRLPLLEEGVGRRSGREAGRGGRSGQEESATQQAGATWRASSVSGGGRRARHSMAAARGEGTVHSD